MKIKYKDMKVKRIYLLLTFSIMLLSTGCGYNVGKISNPQIKTIAIAPIKNECYLPNMSEYMRNALSEAFGVDGSYSVKNIYTADCILYGRITDTKVTAVDIGSSTSGTTFVTNEYKMAITFEFTVVIPGQADALVPTAVVQGDAQYSVPVDQFVAQMNGIKQASWDAARKVVWKCTETW